MLYEKMVGLIANIHLYLVRFMRLRVLLFCACSLVSAEHTFSSHATSPSQASRDEQTLWGLERAYWRYVEDNDLAAYSDLWHKDFLGWPSVSSAPVRKDHITDWITSQTAKGLAFKTVEFNTAAIQITGDVAFACDWVTCRWVDKEGGEAPHPFRIAHESLRSGNDGRIRAGMSV